MFKVRSESGILVVTDVHGRFHGYFTWAEVFNLGILGV